MKKKKLIKQIKTGFKYLYYLLPIMQIAVDLRIGKPKSMDVTAESSDPEATVDLKKRNVMSKLVIPCVVLALTALLRHIAITKLKRIPELIRSRRNICVSKLSFLL